MKILGMNRKVCKNLWVAYVVVNGNKYFHGAYRSKENAQRIALKYNGKYTFIS